MQLTRNFFKALAPCVIACAQALAVPAVSAETVTPVQEPAIAAVVVNPHSLPSAQASYMEWRRRLIETRSEVTNETVQAVAMNNQVVASGFAPHPA